MACTQYFLWFSDFSAWIFRLGFFGQSIKPLFVYSTISMCIIQALCVFYNLYVYSIIPLCILHSLCIFFNLYMYHTSSMCILQSPCVFYNPFVYSIISMCILQSLCVFYNLFVYTTISLMPPRIRFTCWTSRRCSGGTGTDRCCWSRSLPARSKRSKRKIYFTRVTVYNCVSDRECCFMTSVRFCMGRMKAQWSH